MVGEVESRGLLEFSYGGVDGAGLAEQVDVLAVAGGADPGKQRGAALENPFVVVGREHAGEEAVVDELSLQVGDCRGRVCLDALADPGVDRVPQRFGGGITAGMPGRGHVRVSRACRMSAARVSVFWVE